MVCGCAQWHLPHRLSWGFSRGAIFSVARQRASVASSLIDTSYGLFMAVFGAFPVGAFPVGVPRVLIRGCRAACADAGRRAGS